MNEVTDIIDRPIRIGDFVAFYANVYKVLDTGKPSVTGHGYCKIILADPSPTTRPVRKYSREMCVIPAEEVTFWLLKRKQS
jgi:hypothetical protein